MTKPKKLMELKFERTLLTTPREAYAAWLDPKVPGTPWHEGDKLLLHPKIDGFFYWFINDTAHYGRFTKLERARRIQHTWMSRYTEGEESTVTVTFAKAEGGTRMTLVHAGLPDNEAGRAHDEGWNYFLDKFPKGLGRKSAKKNSKQKPKRKQA
jgi:uncharacterized protein YndB with AHSA1/START domain